MVELKKLTRKLLFLAGSTSFGLCLGELVLAWTGALEPGSAPLYPGDRETQAHAQADPHVGWTLPPSAVSQDRHRDYHVSYTAGATGFRSGADDGGAAGTVVAFLGDSMTLGTGVEDHETFAEQVEALSPNMRSLNFGMSGFGIDQMWMALRHYALPQDPDLVVVAFILDDLNRSLTCYRKRGIWMQKPTFRLQAGELVPLTMENRPGWIRRFVEQQSQLREAWRRVENRVFRTRARGYRWRLNRAIFAAMSRDCREAGVPLMAVFLIPREEPNRYASMRAGFAELGIPLLDLQDELRDDGWSLFFEHDRHLDPSGHAFVAERIVLFAEQSGLLPRDRE